MSKRSGNGRVFFRRWVSSNFKQVDIFQADVYAKKQNVDG